MQPTSDKPEATPRHGAVSWVAVVGAMLLWGSWCYIANAGVPFATRLGLSLAQAAASSLITVLLARGVAMGLCLGRYRRVILVFVPLGCVTLTGSGLWCLHTWLGTPAIAATITPPIMVAWAFCQFTAWQLYRRRMTSADSP